MCQSVKDDMSLCSLLYSVKCVSQAESEIALLSLIPGRADTSVCFVFDLPASLSLPLIYTESISSPVKLLLLMMGGWGLFQNYTPPHLHLPIAIQASIFP